VRRAWHGRIPLEGRTRGLRWALLVLGVAALAICARSIAVARHYTYRDVGAGSLYGPYIVNNGRSIYYGVHVRIASQGRVLTVEDRDNPLYPLVQAADALASAPFPAYSGAAFLPVVIDINPYLGEVDRVTYAGHVYDVNGSRAQSYTFAVVAGVVGLLLAGINGFALLSARRERGGTSDSP
jgi:hypothetical protein